MNSKDLQIISYLRKNARIPLTKLSRKTNIPVSTIFDRLKANENEIIKRHTCLIDFAKLGYSIRANITFSVERDDKNSLRDFLVKHRSINSVYRVSGGYDFMVEGIFKQINNMDDFIDDVESQYKIKDKNSFFVIEELKKESFLSDPELIDLTLGA